MTLSEAATALAKKLPLENLELRKRFDRAYDIVRMPGYELTKYRISEESDDTYYLIDKLSSSLTEDTAAQYTVWPDRHRDCEPGSCTCPDFADGKAPAGLCKHRLAVALIELMNGE